jgi:hypothetical protein
VPRELWLQDWVIVENDGTLPQYDKQFTKFSLLPQEIRLQIWKHALPAPREFATTRGGILVIVNFELARPRVIIPSPRYIFFLLDFYGDEYSADDMVFEWQIRIFNILHATRESRDVTLEEYRLDIKSIIPEENTPWWDEDDVVYFPTDTRIGDTARLQWMSEKRPGRLHYLPSINHIAMEVTHPAMEALGFLVEYEPGDFPEESENPLHIHRGSGWHFDWPTNFPFLKTMCLMFDPGEVGGRENGRLKLYAADDVLVRDIGLKPSQIEERAALRLKQAFQMDYPNGDPELSNWSVPAVECSVMCWKKP